MIEFDKSEKGIGRDKVIYDLMKQLEKSDKALNECMSQDERLKKSLCRKHKTIEKLRSDCDREYIGALHSELELLRGLKENYIEQRR